MMMAPKNRLFKKEYAKELLGIASGDYTSARSLRGLSGRPENIVFLCQQSVEKSIKAVLVHFQIAFPMVHDLGILLGHLKEVDLPPGGFNLTQFNPFASNRRYEEGPLPLSDEEIQIAIDTTNAVLAWAHSKILS